MIQVKLDLNSVEDYRLFLRIKALPRWSVQGHTASFPEEYADAVGMKVKPVREKKYVPFRSVKIPPFDYQRAIAPLAIRKRKFAVFMECGYGKSYIDFEFARAALAASKKRILIVCPLNVVRQMLQERDLFYGDSLPIDHVRAAGLPEWLCGDKPGIGITNYEAIREGLPRGNLGGLILSESSMLKSHYGKWGQRLIEMGRGLDWKLCETGTPAPNDRIEYANHAVFLDAFPTVNSFLARFFVNRGETCERWELKPHALRPFYNALSHWCIFVTNPATYGWRDNCGTIPPIHVHIDDVPMTQEQRDAVFAETGCLICDTPGGITKRSILGRIGKGIWRGKPIKTNKPAFLRGLVDSWPDESTLLWCIYNAEQEEAERIFPEAASLAGKTPQDAREQAIDAFKSGRQRLLISKAEILGFGLNLHRATRQLFSGIEDSYESYWQCVKRSNRVGSTRPLNVHIPVTEAERPMVDTVIRKAARVQADTEEQEALFKENAHGLEF